MERGVRTLYLCYRAAVTAILACFAATAAPYGRCTLTPRSITGLTGLALHTGLKQYSSCRWKYDPIIEGILESRSDRSLIPFVSPQVKPQQSLSQWGERYCRWGVGRIFVIFFEFFEKCALGSCVHERR